MNSQKAFIGMSGGVDSSVAAYLTIRAGMPCVGATMHLYHTTDTSDARAVAQRLGIDFVALDLSAEFRSRVMDSFVSSYEAGLTPNPCIVCNRYLKFGLFLEEAQKHGCGCVVTGHYAMITQKDDRFLLQKAADTAKDQTYFLYTLTQHQLAHTRFPLGELTKAQVRTIAEEQGFLNARKRDSQDICFIPDGNYKAFLEQYTGKHYCPGSFLDLNGNPVGQHGGAVGYTLGQRKGLGIALGEPVYVCAKDMLANTVTVGPNEALFRKTLRANDLNWIAIDTIVSPLRVKAKARSRMTEQDATVYPEDNGFVRVEFDEPQRAITPGQAIVFYDGDTVVGGGTITEVL